MMSCYFSACCIASCEPAQIQGSISKMKGGPASSGGGGSVAVKYVLKRVSFGSKDCTKELKLECAYFLGQTS